MNVGRKARFALMTAVALVAMWLVASVIMYASFWLIKWVAFGLRWGTSSTELGEFGDQFGSINAVFSGLAFFAVIATLYLQYRELRSQHQDSLESKRQDRVQQFERTFLQMLDILREQRDGLRGYVHKQAKWYIEPSTVAFGERESANHIGKSGSEMFECIAVWVRERDKRVAENPIQNGPHFSPVELYENAYQFFFRNQLGAYFRVLYRMMVVLDREIESGVFNEPSQRQSAEDLYKVLRAQMSESELAITFLNCQTKYGAQLKPLADKYRLFDNLDPSFFIRLPGPRSSDSSFVGYSGTLPDPFDFKDRGEQGFVDRQAADREARPAPPEN